jgi:hypothetical protein
MFAATTSPSYSPTWVSGQMPVTSPIAHRALAGAQVLVNLDAVGWPRRRRFSRPIPRRAGAAPVATSSRSPRSSGPASNSRTYSSPVRRAAAGVHPEHQLDAVAAQASPSAVAQGRGLARQHAVGALDEHRLAARRPHDLRELDALPTRHPARAGGAGRPSCSSPRGAPRRPRAPAARDRRHDRIRAGRHDDVLAVWRTPRPRPTPVPASRPCLAAGRCRGPPASAPGRRRSIRTP